MAFLLPTVALYSFSFPCPFLLISYFLVLNFFFSISVHVLFYYLLLSLFIPFCTPLSWPLSFSFSCYDSSFLVFPRPFPFICHVLSLFLFSFFFFLCSYPLFLSLLSIVSLVLSAVFSSHTFNCVQCWLHQIIYLVNVCLSLRVLHHERTVSQFEMQD